MIRTVLAVAMLALGINAATADAIADRKAIMKENGAQNKIAGAMDKGTQPFDLAKAKKVFATFASSAEKMPGLFPANSKTGGKTTAAPKVWEDMAGFKAAFAKFDKESKAAEASVKDLASFKTAYANVRKNCGGCHKVYRVKKK